MSLARSAPRALVLAVIPLPTGTVAALEARYDLHYLPAGLREGIDAALARRVSAVVTNGSTGLSDAQMADLPALEIICALGAGHENVDVGAAAARGIVVTHAPGANAATVADHALGLMLALSRGYAPLTEAVRRGAWQASRAERPTLHGAALGIIGMGRVGRLIATRAAGFSMRLGYYGPSACADVDGTYYADLTALARASDFLVACCPGGSATRHLINRDVLRALGPQGFVVNVSRGSVLATDELIGALRHNEIAGAGLDVLESEPDVPATLSRFDNVLLTPHIAGRSPASLLAQRDTLLTSLAEHFAGHPIALQVHVG
ncbi:hydroxyacid dehydrogenase [Pandoraea terrae]|uniref:Hydroxyacid dehydrogenase n=1 Tax=Pandoraea terrae TaxID=1537710 RepID=A0A5E4XTG9_9BURK|nr:2-hydroxyacid dehydrogenase [Pandoraea terrae]VVE39626.1 hydroxyacid dehydrogenase [Pandoraea terrae]